MRCHIILNGRNPGQIKERELRFYRSLSISSDMIICADGGLNVAAAAGIEPDVVIGDMDSADPELLKNTDEARIIRHPADKDLTDGRLALDYAVDAGCAEIVISCALSSIIDHSLANIQMLSSVPEDINVRIMEPDVCVSVITGPTSHVINGEKGERVSLLPLSEEVDGITLAGLKYPMNGGHFSIKGMNGISNEMEGDMASVSVKKGVLAVFHHTNGQV